MFNCSTSSRLGETPAQILWPSFGHLFGSSPSKKLTGVAARVARIRPRPARLHSTSNVTAIRGLVVALAPLVGLGKSKKRLRVTKGVSDELRPFRFDRCLSVAVSLLLRNCRPLLFLGVFSWGGGVR